MGVFGFVTLNNRVVKLPEKITAIVSESDMIHYGNSFDKLSE